MAPKHRSSKKRSNSFWIAGSIIVAVLIIGSGVSVGLYEHHKTQPQASPQNATPSFAVLMATPSNTATVDSNAAIRIQLSSPLSASSPLPSISPAITGSWQNLSATTLEYVQQTPFSPGQSVTVTIPGGSTGLTSNHGKHLASSTTTTFQVAPLSILRVQQLLAQLGYLPVTFTPTTPDTSQEVSTATLDGTFSPRWSTLPSSLISQWHPGVDNVVTKGAIMTFENDHGMKSDGIAGPIVWNQLISDASQNKLDPNAYNYVSVSQALPETLTLYSNGQAVHTNLVNTGVTGAITEVGTFPVFEHLVSTTMSGTNPDGSTYVDPGIPWVSYFNGGDALHGFIRSSYGFPQSDGCVEMPYADAQTVWPDTPIGTLVTVQ